MLNSIDPGLQMAVSSLTWVLGIELQSSARVASTLNHWLSLQPWNIPLFIWMLDVLGLPKTLLDGPRRKNLLLQPLLLLCLSCLSFNVSKVRNSRKSN